MKRIGVLLCLAFLLPVLTAVYGQSIRQSPGGTDKRNRRPAATPTPPRPADAAPAEDAEDSGEIVTVDTKLVTVPVKIIDRKGNFVPGLTMSDFTVFENGARQEVTHFSNEQEPFTVALILDMSYSATFKLKDIHTAAIAFVDQLRPEDKVMVVSFDMEVAVRCDVTSDRDTIYKAITSTKIGTGTSVYDAVSYVLNDRLRRIEGRKAAILFTDGVDTSSEKANDSGNLADAMESDSIIYPIRYDTFADVQAMKDKPVAGSQGPRGTPPTVPSNRPSIIPIPVEMIAMPSSRGTSAEEYARAEEYLRQLAARTGGEIYVASSLDNLAGAFAKIAAELREYYSLGYYPAAEGVPGQSVRIKVQVNRPNVAVRARTSYVVAKDKPKKK